MYYLYQACECHGQEDWPLLGIFSSLPRPMDLASSDTWVGIDLQRWAVKAERWGQHLTAIDRDQCSVYYYEPTQADWIQLE